MDTKTLLFKVRQCFKCLGATVYFCQSCPCGLCIQCKETHGYDIKTMNHNVILYGRKGEGISTQDEYVKLPGMVNEECMDSSTQHRNSTKYRTKQSNQIIHTIKSEALFYRQVLLRETKADVIKCHKEFSLFQSDISKRARRMQNRLDNVELDVDFKHRCLKQKRKIYSHISKIQRYEQTRHEYSSNKPVQFLLNKTRIPKITFSPSLTLHTNRFSMNDSLSMEDVGELLTVVQLIEKGVRRVGNDRLLKLMSGPEILQFFDVLGVEICTHIATVTTDLVWVSDANNLILINTTGNSLHHFKFNTNNYLSYGVHTVTSDNEVIYIDRNYNINKLAKDMKTTTTFIERTDSTWWPQCVYWSPSTGDLLVGMCSIHTIQQKSKVIRYNKTGQLTQTIQQDDMGLEMYRNPSYITENNNGDLVVSDCCALVVTDCRGRHRFSYARAPSGSELGPAGICTDALSNILVCDYKTNTVQILNKNGQFLSPLLIRPSGIFAPQSLAYDVVNHCLWVGSAVSNRVCVYRYIDRQDVLIDRDDNFNGLEGEIPTTGTEKPQRRSKCALKLMSTPKLLNSITLTNIRCCGYVSCLRSDRAWVSDGKNLILINKVGDTLHHLKYFNVNLLGEVHTINSENELIYLHLNKECMDTVTKLSNDMKTKTDIMVTKNLMWSPQCVYWSLSTEDLLIGMIKWNYHSSKILRYNQTGLLTQTIEHDNTGLELYKDVISITENTNGDVVVSDFDLFSGAVVVTERGGRHRFTYTGHPPGSELQPRGICTDSLSNILVCDEKTEALQILNSDGQFLSLIYSKSLKIVKPRGLSYDYNTHRLWVGSEENKLCVIHYLTDETILTEEPKHNPVVDTVSTLIQACE